VGSVRQERIVRRRKALITRDGSGASPITWVQVLYLAHCTRTKGLFDAIEGVRHANDQLSRQGTGIRLKLNVAGEFLEESERAEFQKILAAAGPGGWLQHWGFVQGAAKEELFREADLFCFPTFFPNEGHPVALLEAMAWGLVPVATRWRGIPELFAPDYAGLVEPRQPPEVARALISVLEVEGGQFRARFCESYLLDCHLLRLAKALRELSEEAGA
jgi:glycosyltransferase involved in cell wall biosynthesis